MTRGVPKVEWPNGARIAVVLQVPFEQFDKAAAFAQYLVNVPALPPEQVAAGQRDLLVRSWEEYCEIGMWRLIRLLDRHGVTATGVFSGIAAERYPEVTRAFVGDLKREICAHSWAQDIHTYHLSDAEMTANVARCVDVIERIGGTRPVGWVSPGGQFRPSTTKILADGGFLYHGDYANSDAPFWIEVEGGRRLVGMSVPWDTNDTMQIRYGAPPSHYVEFFARSFDVLYEEGGQILGAVAHAGTYGRPPGIWAYDQIIQYAKKHDKVWFATRRQIAEWFAERYQ